MHHFFELIGYLAGIATAVCFLPQTIKTIRTKDVRGLSLWSYVLYSFGIFSWVIYGFYMHSVQMVLFNSISLVFAGTITAYIILYQNQLPSKKRAKK